MLRIGDVISYWEMCLEEKSNLQRGMYFRHHGKYSILLMSVRPGAPYADRVENGGKTLIYEGHDAPRKGRIGDPKSLDQPMVIDGKLTQNGLFFNAAKVAQNGSGQPVLVKVYEKVKSGIWVYDGIFKLLDSWVEPSGPRSVFKFRLEILDTTQKELFDEEDLNDNPRMIPTDVKVEVWKRDNARCVKCGSPNNLHFDHIIPYSKGGSSSSAANIQILCSRCNLEKRDHIE